MVWKRFKYDGERVLVPLLEEGEAVSPKYVRRLSRAIKSDGCSGVPDFYLSCCIVHDLAYKFQVDPWGRPVTRREADAALRGCIQETSGWGLLSPMAAWRWAAVRLVGWRPWGAHEKART